VDIEESRICRYEAQICTPLLCADSLKENSQSVDRDRIYVQDSTPPTSADSSFTNYNNNNHDTSSTQGYPTTNKIIKKDDSIRDILRWTLGNRCLYKIVGWWSYEFCHGKQLLQYHETTKMDRSSGFMTIIKESGHSLGRYNSEVLEGFPKVDEAKYIAWPVSKRENQLMTPERSSHKASSSSSQREDNSKNEKENDFLKMQRLIRQKAMEMDITTDLEGSGSGAVFVQEYFHGDFCENPEVTESFFGGTEGGIERSTTVRFTCGNSLEFLKVNEDSTCHYIIDITLPELCQHHLFMAPVVKTKVVKCLLVEE